MYKMFIADDEPATRQGIRTAINWSLLDIEIVGEAGDGSQALDLVRSLAPDILICDIRMPKMDGLTLAGILHVEKPDLQIVFLSGYSDKEYLKTAIRIDAIDYLYKPFELDELVAAIKKAKQKLEKKDRLLRPLADSDLALQLLDINRHQSLLEEGRLPLDSRGSFMTVVITVSSPVSKMLGSVSANFLSHRFHESLRKASALIWGSAFVLSMTDEGFLLHANKKAPGPAPKALTGLLDTFEPVIKQTAIGISSLVDKLADLPQAFKQAKKAATAAYLTGYGKINYFDEVSSQPFILQKDFVDQLVTSLARENAAAAISQLKDYIRHMRAASPDEIPAIKDALAQIALEISSRLQKHTGQDSHVLDVIFTALDLEEISNYLVNLIEQYLEEAGRLSSMGRIVYEAEKYILAHVEEHDLSVKQIASQVHVTPTYLCYIYKKYTGRTINSFIMETKMKRAQELVLDTKLPFGEIASRLGYANQNYFARTFSRFYGVNPSTYRNKAL